MSHEAFSPPVAKTLRNRGKKILRPYVPRHKELILPLGTTPTATQNNKRRLGIKLPESGSQMGFEICLSHNVYCEGPFTASQDITTPKKGVSQQGGVHRRKERTNFKEGFKLELTGGGKKKGANVCGDRKVESGVMRHRALRRMKK